MTVSTRRYIILTGIVALIGALLHIAIMLGGPDWYDFFGAPEGLVQMARAGSLRAPISCLIIAGILFVFAAYAFSAAGLIKRLPLLRIITGLIATVLVVRGLTFIPLILWKPKILSGICDCRSVDAFILVTSLICLAMGIGYAMAAIFSDRALVRL
jgi:putative oxidoreductase